MENTLVEQILAWLKSNLKVKKTGLPTRFYTGSERMGDFSVPERLYDFSVPSPEPGLSELRKPADLDLDLARSLFLPANSVRLPDESTANLNTAKRDAEDDEKSRGTVVSAGRHYGMSLFIAKIPKWRF